MDGFWERTREFIERLILAVAYAVLLAMVGGLPILNLILFLVAMIILDFVYVIEDTGKVRIIFFVASSLLLIIPAAMLHFSLMSGDVPASDAPNSALLSSFFTATTAIPFALWLGMSKGNDKICYADLIIYVGCAVLALVLGDSTTIFLILGIILIALLPLFRFVILRDSAFEGLGKGWDRIYDRASDAVSSVIGDDGFGPNIDAATGKKIKKAIDGKIYSYGKGYFVAHYDRGRIMVEMNGYAFDINVGDYKRAVESDIVRTLEWEGLPVPSITFYD